MPCRVDGQKGIIASNTIWHRREACAILYAYIRQIYWIESPKFVRLHRIYTRVCVLYRVCVDGGGNRYIIWIQEMQLNVVSLHDNVLATFSFFSNTHFPAQSTLTDMRYNDRIGSPAWVHRLTVSVLYIAEYPATGVLNGRARNNLNFRQLNWNLHRWWTRANASHKAFSTHSFSLAMEIQCDDSGMGYFTLFLSHISAALAHTQRNQLSRALYPIFAFSFFIALYSSFGQCDTCHRHNTLVSILKCTNYCYVCCARLV